MFSFSRSIHPLFLFALAIFAAYLAIFLLAAYPEHDHDQQQCTVCAWFNSLSVVLPAVLAVQFCFLHFCQWFSSRRALRTSFLLPDGRAPPVS